MQNMPRGDDTAHKGIERQVTTKACESSAKLCAHSHLRSFCSLAFDYPFAPIQGAIHRAASRSGCMEAWSNLSAGHMRQGNAQDLRKQTALLGYATPEGTKLFSIFYPASSLHAVAETHFRYDPSLGDMEAPGAITVPAACADCSLQCPRERCCHRIPCLDCNTL